MRQHGFERASRKSTVSSGISVAACCGAADLEGARLRARPFPIQDSMRNALLEVTPTIPGALARLPELAANLFFSWHRPTRALFEDLDSPLWEQTGGNPRLLLRCVEQRNLDRAA